MHSTLPELLDPPWFFPFFATMWVGISGLLSIWSGWSGLAARFRATGNAVGEHFRFASGSIGASTWLPVNYRSCLFFTVGTTGFGLSIFFPFRFLTPPLFIPWSEVESITEQRSWFIRRAVIHVRGSSSKIMVPGRAGQCLTQAYARYSAHRLR